MDCNPETPVFFSPELPVRIQRRIAAEILGKRELAVGYSPRLLGGISFFIVLMILWQNSTFTLVGFIGMLLSLFLLRNRASPIASRYRDSYVSAKDLDPVSLDLMMRVLKAVDFITQSRVSAQGLLDDAANDIVLPRQVWEIARVLRQQTELQAELADTETSLMTEELAAVLHPQRQALLHSVAAITGRVERLETYAQQVRAADSALEARDRLQDNDKYRELLAQTDDETAMTSLDAQASTIEETLRSNLQKALAAGEALVVPSPEGTNS